MNRRQALKILTGIPILGSLFTPPQDRKPTKEEIANSLIIFYEPGTGKYAYKEGVTGKLEYGQHE